MVQVSAYWKVRFATYRNDSLTDFEWALRQVRATQINRLLDDPENLDVPTFTREVWLFGPRFKFQGRWYRFYGDYDRISPDERSQLLQAIESGDLVLHGNYMWATPQRAFDQNCHDELVKIANIRKALDALHDTNLEPKEKAHKIMGIQGFGSNGATALVWLRHPDEYTICNRRSIFAVNAITGSDLSQLKPRIEEIDQFEELAAELKEIFGAPDFFVLDGFFDHVYCTWKYEAIPESAVQVGDDELKAYPEGGAKYVTHLRHERNPGLVAAKKDVFFQENRRFFCEACNFDFAKVYGERGHGYIEVHHKTPVSEMEEGHATTVEDVVLVCPNCHKMLHRHKPLLTIEQLKKLIDDARQRRITRGQPSPLDTK